MTTGVTKSGFAFEVPEGIENDFRVLEAIADADSEDASAKLRGTVELVRLLLGEDGKKRLYRKLRAECGSVPTEKVIAEVTEILQIAGERSKPIKN